MATRKKIIEDIKNTIQDLKEVLERYADEECGVDPDSGHYGQTSGYITKIQFETQLHTLESVLEMLERKSK